MNFRRDKGVIFKGTLFSKLSSEQNLNFILQAFL